jgi:hypothetical protein
MDADGRGWTRIALVYRDEVPLEAKRMKPSYQLHGSVFERMPVPPMPRLPVGTVDRDWGLDLDEVIERRSFVRGKDYVTLGRLLHTQENEYAGLFPHVFGSDELEYYVGSYLSAAAFSIACVTPSTDQCGFNPDGEDDERFGSMDIGLFCCAIETALERDFWQKWQVAIRHEVAVLSKRFLDDLQGDNFRHLFDIDESIERLRGVATRINGTWS